MAAAPVSVVLPVRNEEENIRRAIESLAVQPEIAEIVVVDDHSTDRTAEILKNLATRIPHLRVVRNGALPEGSVGKSHALATGAEQARSAWLLFTDADVCHAPGGVGRALALARQSGAALVSFSPAQEMASWWERAVIPRVYTALAQEFSYEAVSDPARPVAAANGQFLLVRREVYEATGAADAIEREILDDVALARRVKDAGYCLHFAPGEDIARTRMYRRFPEMWRGWTKNLFPLLGANWRCVGGWLAKIFFADLSPVVVLLTAAVAWGRGGGAGWLAAAGLAAAILVVRHLLYARALRANRFPLHSIWYYVVGSLLFAALMVHSAVKYTRGRIEWKGRSYAV